MAKHKQYSKTFGVFYDYFRKWCKDMASRGELTDKPEEQFQDFFLSNFATSIDDATAMQLFVRDVRKELLHIYMSDESLQDFLKNVDVRDLKGIKKYISENGNKVLVNEDDSMQNITEGTNLAFCLHIPNEKQGYVLCYSLYENDELRIFVNHGQEQFHISSLDYDNKKSILYQDKEIYDIAIFAINLVAYISCFPDCLVDGAPHGIKTENNHRLRTSEKIMDKQTSDNGIVNPHFRRGYFKRLESDFYKNKKGQIVFVHETVVNAQAKTLESVN